MTGADKSQAELLRELARVKAIFQLAAICIVMAIPDNKVRALTEKDTTDAR